MPLNTNIPSIITKKSAKFQISKNFKEMYLDEIGSYLAKYGSEYGDYISYTSYVRDGNQYPYGIYAKDGILYYTIKTSKYGPRYTTTFVIENTNTGSTTTSPLTLVAPSSDITGSPYKNPIVYPLKNDSNNVIILLTADGYDIWYRYSLTNKSITFIRTERNFQSPSSSYLMTTCTDGLNVYCFYAQENNIIKISLNTITYTTIPDSILTKDTNGWIMFVNLSDSGYILCMYSYGVLTEPIVSYLRNISTNDMISLKSIGMYTTADLPRNFTSSQSTAYPQPNTYVGALKTSHNTYTVCIDSSIYVVNIDLKTIECVNYKSASDLKYVPTHLKNGRVILPSGIPDYAAYAFVNDINQQNLYFIEIASMSYAPDSTYQSVGGIKDYIETMFKVYIE